MSEHRERRSRRVVVLAGGVTAAVALGAAALVAGRGPAPSPRAVDRPPAAVSAGPSASSGPSGSAGPSAGRSADLAGTFRPAPRTTTPVPTTAPPAPASRDRRPAPAPTTRAAAPGAGTATFYTLTGLPNCGYPDAAATGRYVALGPAQWAGSASCGTVYDVTGPEGTVRVTVSDQCPECAAGHLDLAAPAFARIADPVAGQVPVTYTRVVDPPVGPVRIRVKEGSSRYWLALLPMDTGNPLTAVSIDGRALQRSGYGYWVAASGAGPGPFQVRLTDDRGHTAIATVPLSVGATVTTGTRLY